MSFTTVLENTLLLTVMILSGYGLTKIGMITKPTNDFMTRLLLDFIIPCAVLNASCTDLGDTSALNTLMIIAAMTGLLLLFTFLGNIVAKIMRQDEDYSLIISRSIAYPNSGFMGMPLCTALFGAQGTIWCAIFILVSNLYLFFFLQNSFRRDKGGDTKAQLKALLTPLNIASIGMLVIMLTGIKMPSFPRQYISSFGACMTPLAMLVVGCLLASSPLADALKDWRLYVITLFRNIITPLITALLLGLIGWNGDLGLCTTLIFGCSIASTVSIIGSRFDRAPVFAGQALLQTTLLLPITLPVVMVIADMIL